MKFLAYAMLILLVTACATPTVEMRRLKPPKVHGPNLMNYTHLVVAAPEIKSTAAAAAIQQVIINELNKSKIYESVPEVSYQEGEGKYAILLTTKAALATKKDPPQKSTFYNPLTKRTETMATQLVTVSAAVEFCLSDFHARGDCLYQESKSQSAADTSKAYQGAEPMMVDEGKLAGQCVMQCVQALVEDIFPHYETTVYKLRKSKRLKQNMDEGLGYFKNKDFVLAEKSFRAAVEQGEAVKAKPWQRAQSKFLLGLPLEAQGKFEEAIASYDEAIRLNPDDNYFHARKNAQELKEYIDSLKAQTAPASGSVKTD